MGASKVVVFLPKLTTRATWQKLPISKTVLPPQRELFSEIPFNNLSTHSKVDLQAMGISFQIMRLETAR